MGHNGFLKCDRRADELSGRSVLVSDLIGGTIDGWVACLFGVLH